MLARATTFTVVGLDARVVEVEAHAPSGLFAFAIVGLADRACQEARHRVRSGIDSASLEFPLNRRVTVNLAPADLRKEGSGFDLPIALAVLGALRQLPPACLAGLALLGELGLDGSIRSVTGALAVAEAARRFGCERLLCAEASASEASLAGIEVIPLRHLAQAVSFLQGDTPIEPAPAPEPRPRLGGLPDLADVRGQERGRRALEIAAAGRHNLLLSGPPGTGKTMLARRLPSILPPLAREEALEVTRIHSVAGTLGDTGLVDAPPFRAPHHSASTAAIVGGGTVPRPGEASLAHHGVLLLDEFPEFPRPVLEALRQPLEDGFISVARVGGRAVFPARFQLVATRNLCPCGARGDPAAECRCTPQRVAAYHDKVSRPLLDRFDLLVAMPRPRAAELAGSQAELSEDVRSRVVEGRRLLDVHSLGRTSAASELLDRAVERLGLSGRGRARVARVSRTIAALHQQTSVLPEHVAEALTYRVPTGEAR